MTQIFNNPLWMHTAEYMRGVMKFELYAWFLVYMIISAVLVYRVYKKGSLQSILILALWIVCSGVFWLFYVLSFAQRWFLVG